MPHYVYILYSPTLCRFYVGQSQYRHKRCRQHCQASRGTWTSQAQDWEPVFTEQVPRREDAVALEQRIKRRGAKRFLEDRGVPFVQAAD